MKHLLFTALIAVGLVIASPTIAQPVPSDDEVAFAETPTAGVMIAEAPRRTVESPPIYDLDGGPVAAPQALLAPDDGQTPPIYDLDGGPLPPTAGDGDAEPVVPDIDALDDPEAATGAVLDALKAGGWSAAVGVLLILLSSTLRPRLADWKPWFSTVLGELVLHLSLGALAGVGLTIYNGDLSWKVASTTIVAMALSAFHRARALKKSNA